MDLNHLISLKIVFFLLAVLTINTSGQICSHPLTASLNENNTVGETVTNITIQAGVSLEIIENPDDAFGISGNSLVAIKVLDYETLPNGGAQGVSIKCTKDQETSVLTLTLRVIVLVININDNPPVFAKNPETLTINELSKVGTSVGKIEATDLDKTQLYYRLESPMDEFGLRAESDPQILVKKVLDYDTTKEVTLNLFAQDTPLSSADTPSHTATTTIIVTVLDINNRPPWFQPCTESTVGTTKVCVTSGYTGNVNLNEQMTGALTLKPGPVHAIDGDNGRNDPIRYKIIAGNDAFVIDENSGDITMQKSVGIAGPIMLTVMAYELEEPDQFATTTVTLKVVISSKHPPQFVKPTYEGFISQEAGVGSLVLESKSSNKPLRVQAKDDDFSDGVNPNIRFEVPLDSDFKITSEGYIVMTRDPSPGNVDLQIRVVDATNDESSTASVSVEVIPGVTTTEMFTTTNRPTITAMTTNMATDTTTDTVTQLTESTYSPHTISTNPATTHSPHTGGPSPFGNFRTEDMVALGVSLAVALLLCFVVIGFLAYNLKRFNTDWKKLSEASIFRSSLSGGSGGPKDGVQYTNKGFQAEEDAGRVPEVQETKRSAPVMQSKSSNNNATLPTDSTSQNASDSTDNEKEVKPILTKERRMEEGYKAVWFKEDINPNDKEEVLISDRDHEEEEEEEEEEEDDHDDEDEDEEEKDSNFAQL